MTGENCQPALYRTDDGAATWSAVTPKALTTLLFSQEGPCAAFFLDANHPWVSVTTATATGGSPEALILRTSDRGATWSAANLPASVERAVLASMDFIDPAHGWFADLGAPTSLFAEESVALWATSDGGATWHLVSQSAGPSLPVSSPAPSPGQLPYSCGKDGVSFASVTTGWITGGCQAGVSFFVTHDGGAAWVPQSLPPPSGGMNCGPSACDLVPPHFTSATDGTMLLNDDPASSRTTLYVTHDGGATWAPRALPEPSDVQQVLFVNAEDGLLISEATGAGMDTYATTDGGVTWQRRATVPDQGIGILEGFTDADHGFLQIPNTGSNVPTILYATADGGRNWSPFVSRLAD